MKLDFNSNTAKLYRWFYVTPGMPQNLCPYFWKLVAMWLLIVPYTILSLPYIVFYKSDKGSSVIEKPASGLITWGVILLAACMIFSISLFWFRFDKDSILTEFQITGVLLWIITLGFATYNLIKWGWKKYKESKIQYKYDENGRKFRVWSQVEEKSPSIIKEFIKAKYDRYCPKIDWKK